MMNTQGEYTQFLYDELWNVVGRDYERDYESEEVLAKLNDPDSIRPFCKRLLSFYNDILGKEFLADEAKADLLKRAKNANISLNRNTITNWFSGNTEPKYGDDDRRRLFAIAFALQLDAKNTERLFHNVFLDKAFNKRNAEEFIYLHCIHNKKPFSTAEMLIDRLDSMDLSETRKEQTEHTQFLGAAASKDISEDELLKFITNHQHNFSLNNTAAKKQRQRLLDELTGGDSGKPGLAEREYEHRRQELADEKDGLGFGGRDRTSIDFLLYMIFDVDYAKMRNDDITSIRERFPRKEVSNQFPDKNSLSKKDPLSYILRKDIILLYFYRYWVADFLEGEDRGDYDSFVDDMNGRLFECGFSPLYIGNPYDWLFLYCSACADENYSPLDRLRGLVSVSG